VTGEAGGGNHSHLGYIWDARTGRKLHDLRTENHYGFVGTFSPDSRKLIGEVDSDVIGAWEVASGEPIYRLDHINYFGLKLSADGTRILIFSRKDDPSKVAQCSVQVRDAATGLLLNIIEFRLRDVSAETLSAGHIRFVAYAFSPDGSEVMIGGQEDGSAHILNTASGGVVRSFEGHVGPVNSVAFSPIGSMVLTAGDDHAVRLWDHEDGRLLHILEGHQGSVERAFFSPDGSRVVAYTDNDRIWLWDTKTGRGLELQH
jgi:WD40 repeat protein